MELKARWMRRGDENGHFQKWDMLNPWVHDQVWDHHRENFNFGSAVCLYICQTHLYWRTMENVSASYQAHHYLDVLHFFSRTLAWFVPLKLGFMQVLTAIVSGSNASDIHQFRSWFLLWSRIRGYPRYVWGRLIPQQADFANWNGSRTMAVTRRPWSSQTFWISLLCPDAWLEHSTLPYEAHVFQASFTKDFLEKTGQKRYTSVP